jgi:hypothetical protein
MTLVLLAGQLAFGQGRPPAPPPDDPLRAIEIRQKQLDIEQRQAEMYFNNEMRNIQLEQKRLELDHSRQMLKGQEQKPGQGHNAWQRHHCKMMHVCGIIIICLIVNILLACWVYQDIRKRNAGSGLWIVVTLLTGLPGALVYAIVRLGDKPA